MGSEDADVSGLHCDPAVLSCTKPGCDPGTARKAELGSEYADHQTECASDKG